MQLTMTTQLASCNQAAQCRQQAQVVGVGVVGLGMVGVELRVEKQCKLRTKKPSGTHDSQLSPHASIAVPVLMPGNFTATLSENTSIAYELFTALGSGGSSDASMQCDEHTQPHLQG